MCMHVCVRARKIYNGESAWGYPVPTSFPEERRCGSVHRLRRKFTVGSVFLAYFWSGSMIGLARAQAAEGQNCAKSLFCRLTAIWLR